MSRTLRSSPLALAVLLMLYEEPMHPYRMQKLIKERGKDQVINVQQRASLYQMINTLTGAGLIRVREVQEQENLPERTIYELTDDGEQQAIHWLREMLATPSEDFPDFPAAVSFLVVLTPEDVLAQFRTRHAALAARKKQLDEETREASAFVPRLFLLEFEYMLTVLDAEMSWVSAIIEALETNTLTWSLEWLESLGMPSQDESGV